MIWSFPRMLEWRIILVNKDSDLHTSFLISSLDDSIQAVGKLGGWERSDSVDCLIFAKTNIEIRANGSLVGSASAHVKTDDRMLVPFLFQLHDSQSLEEFLPTFQVHL